MHEREISDDRDHGNSDQNWLNQVTFLLIFLLILDRIEEI